MALVLCIDGLVMCVEGLVLCAEGLVLCVEVVAGYGNSFLWFRYLPSSMKP